MGHRILRVGIAAWLVAGPPSSTGADAGAPVDLKSPSTIQRGQELFNQACSNCHGEDAGGGLVVFQGRTDLIPQEIFDTISNGRIRGSNLMPAWKESLSEGERWELTAFILSLAAEPARR
jgi:mono/diheme cytochrome c family protein